MELNSPLFITVFFVIFYIIVFLFNYIFNRRKVKKKKYNSIGEMNYLIAKFNLNKKNIDYKHEILYISLLNSFIISSVGTFVTCLDMVIILQLGIGFVLLFALIYSLYEIYGRHLVKKIGVKKK